MQSFLFLDLGLIDEVCEAEDILDTTKNRLREWLKLPSVQQGLTKQKLRKSIADRMEADFEIDTNHIVEIWFNEQGRKVLAALVKSLTRN